MLASLFGDLKANPPAPAAAGDESDHGFAPTAVLETPSNFNVHGQIDDPHAQNVFVTGSPAQAIREHFRRTRGDLDSATQIITLLDASRQRGTPLLKALSEATGAPVERLHLREQATLRTLSQIERTTVQRRAQRTLKLYHADTRGTGSEEAEIASALMERSQLSVVLLEGVSNAAADALITRLHDTASMPTWQCPLLAFLAPEDNAWLDSRLRTTVWPRHTRIEILPCPPRGSSALWNTLLNLWERRGALPAPGEPSSPEPLEPQRVVQQLGQMLQTDGVLGCALVDSSTGILLARQCVPGLPDISAGAAACAQALRAEMHAARSLGVTSPVEEVQFTAGAHQHILRTVANRPGLFLLLLLDRTHTNLALARYKLMEVEKALAA